MIGLDQLGTVYLRGSGGTHTAPSGGPFPVRLCAVSSEGSSTERAELAATRRLLWGPTDAVPEGAEVEVEGERWTAVRGTSARMRGPTGAVVYQRADVVRADA
jgi:hypothetical protein